jgi:hypothetical protein
MTSLDALGGGNLARARQQLHRAHRAQIHANGIVRALDGLLDVGFGRDLLLNLDRPAALALGFLVGLVVLIFVVVAPVLGVDDVHAHFAEHGEDVLDLLGVNLLGGKDRIDLVMGNVAALLGRADEPLDGRTR